MTTDIHHLHGSSGHQLEIRIDGGPFKMASLPSSIQSHGLNAGDPVGSRTIPVVKAPLGNQDGLPPHQ